MSMHILVSGPDGSGKTTIARLIVKLLRQRGYPVLYTWLRYPRLLSLFPLLISRIIGTTTIIKLDNACKYTYHSYATVPILGKLYELSILIDYMIYKFIKVHIPNMLGFIVVVDRNLLDIAIDVYIERRATPKLLLYYLGREAKNALTKIVILASLQNLLTRRKDNLCNPHLKALLVLYQRLGTTYGYNMVYNDSRADLIEIVRCVALKFKPVRIYTEPRSHVLRALFYRHRWLVFVTNFLFQSMGYMWRVELASRLAIQALVAIALVLMGLHTLPALLISHIIMYPFYSNLFAILKWWRKRKINIGKVIRGLKKLVSIENRYRSYIDIVIVGSITRNPSILLTREADIDVRIVPKPRITCIILSLLIGMYIRLWSVANRIPMDLYVKPGNDSEILHGMGLRDLLDYLKSEIGS